MGFGIGEDQPEQQETKRAIFQRSQGESEMRIARHEHRAGEDLHDEIACRDAGLAVSAAAAKHEPAQDGYIVIRSEERRVGKECRSQWARCRTKKWRET